MAQFFLGMFGMHTVLLGLRNIDGLASRQPTLKCWDTLLAVADLGLCSLLTEVTASSSI